MESGLVLWKFIWQLIKDDVPRHCHLTEATREPYSNNIDTNFDIDHLINDHLVMMPE
jgi:hypothetical protein